MRVAERTATVAKNVPIGIVNLARVFELDIIGLQVVITQTVARKRRVQFDLKKSVRSVHSRVEFENCITHQFERRVGLVSVYGVASRQCNHRSMA